MTSNRPYLIRAIYDWIVDNGLTPQVLVDAAGDGVSVPQHFVQDGNILLNIAPRAVRDLALGDELISFNAMFNGAALAVAFPPASVLAVYARENGEGMAFSAADEPAADMPDSEPPTPESSGPTLRVVK